MGRSVRRGGEHRDRPQASGRALVTARPFRKCGKEPRANHGIHANKNQAERKSDFDETYETYFAIIRVIRGPRLNLSALKNPP